MHAATDFLQHHNVYDEPLRWQPNSGLFSACGLRSPTGDLTTIRRLLDDGRTALTDIAAQTGVPLEYLHHLIGEFDPSPAATSINTRLRRAPLRDARYLEG